MNIFWQIQSKLKHAKDNINGLSLKAFRQNLGILKGLNCNVAQPNSQGQQFGTGFRLLIAYYLS